MSERTNMQRATKAWHFCQDIEYVDKRSDQVVAVMSYLMHMCRLIRDDDDKPLDFGQALRMARIHFEAEILKDPDQ